MSDIVVLTAGSFDYVHDGHRFFLEQARALGDRLVTVVARDETIEKIKGRPPHKSIAQRVRDVQWLGLDNHRVVRGSLSDVLDPMRERDPDIVALGYDQTAFIDILESYNLKEKKGIKIVRIDPYQPEKYKSSLIKKELGLL